MARSVRGARDSSGPGRQLFLRQHVDSDPARRGPRLFYRRGWKSLHRRENAAFGVGLRRVRIEEYFTRTSALPAREPTNVPAPAPVFFGAIGTTLATSRSPLDADRLAAGCAANQLARPVAEFANLDALHEIILAKKLRQINESPASLRKRPPAGSSDRPRRVQAL